MKKVVSFILILAMMLTLCACGKQEVAQVQMDASAERGEVTVTDMIGREVAVTPGSYTRVVCIGAGALILLGVTSADTAAQATLLANKVANLRVFCDAQDKLNLSALDVGAELLVVSNFTLCADCSHGRRPDFFGAARPEQAQPLYELFMQNLFSFKMFGKNKHDDAPDSMSMAADMVGGTTSCIEVFRRPF